MNIIGRKKKYRTILENGGIRNFLQLPEKYPILADCGAWGYINNEEEGPPFDSETVFKYYKALGVNEGVTVDHLVLPQIKIGNKQSKWMSNAEWISLIKMEFKDIISGRNNTNKILIFL
jgi:hypothetical protein